MDLDILQYNTLLMNFLSLIFSSVSQVKLNVNISVLVILGEILALHGLCATEAPPVLSESH